jgi:CheY-like chemotaxis protein
MRVLVVEDHEVNLELMCYLLVSFRHAVVTAMDGEAALRAVAQQRFDLVVCDVHMPKMDGLQFLAAIRSRADIAIPPVVAVTASAMVGDREQLLKAGFDGYISKPIDPATFVRQLETFMNERKTAG